MSGMGMFLNVAPELQAQLPPPADFPKCKSMIDSASLASAVVDSRRKWHALVFPDQGPCVLDCPTGIPTWVIAVSCLVFSVCLCALLFKGISRLRQRKQSRSLICDSARPGSVCASAVSLPAV